MKLIKELANRNPALFWLGNINLIGFIVFLILFFIDSRTIGNINVWVKPIKFTTSLWIYSWTLAWILEELPSKKFVKLASVGIFIFMFLEVSLIIMQAARGVSSHFNITTAFDGLIFSLMGVLILINTLILIWITIRFFILKNTNAYVWGIRFGLLILILASVEGGYMASKLSHAVNASNEGSGLPFLGWSKEGGDLRIAHFLGIHALQFLPLFGWQIGKLNLKNRVLITFLGALLYGIMVCYFFYQAMLGIPFLS